MYLRLNVDSFSTRYVADKLDRILQGTEFTGDIGSVVFKPGMGFEVHKFKLVQRASRREMLSVDRIFVAMPTGTKELAQLEIEPDLVELHRAKLMFEQSDFSSGKLQHLLAGLNLETSASVQPIPVRIRDSAFVLLENGQTRIKLDNVALDVNPVGQTQFDIKLMANGEHFQQVQLAANFDSDSQQFQLIGGQAGGSINGPMLNSLPIDLRLQGQPVIDADTTLTGQWTCNCSASGNLNQLADTKFSSNVRLDSVSLNGDHLPVALHNCEAEIQLTEQSVNVKSAKGRVDDGTFQLSYRQNGLVNRRGWSLNGSCDNLRVSEQWKNLGGDHEKLFRAFQPAGLFDIQFQLGSDGKRQITAQLKDTSFSYYKFPYQLKECIGNVRWIDNRLRYDVKTLEHGQLLEISGHIDNPGENATYVCNFGTEGKLPIDERLQNTLVRYPSINGAIRDFRLRGHVSGHGRVEKLTPGRNGKVQKQVAVRLHECDVRHRAFDYPVQKVSGIVQVVDNSFRFENVSGVSATGGVECNGDWNKRDGLNLVFLCSNVLFDAQLRHALTPSLKSIWDSLRPAGEIKLGKVYLNYLAGTGPPDIRVQVNLGGQNDGPRESSVSINPTWFPYPINNLHGKVTVGGGVVTMEDMRGKHDGTWVTCSGTGSYNDARWSVRLFNLLAGSVALDRELLNALPIDLAKALQDLQFQGQFMVGGEITFGSEYVSDYQAQRSPQNPNYPVRTVAFDESAQQKSSIDWNLRFDMDGAQMLVGLPIEDIFGSLFLNGRYNGKIAQTAGRMSIDSLTIYDAQLTNVQGPIWIDNNQTLVGKFVDAAGQPSKPVVATAFGGKVTFDGWLSHEDVLPFYMQAMLEDAELDEAAAELAPQLEEMSGDAFGFIRMQGNSQELHTYKGDGSLYLRNARIHQLPVIISLLKILRNKEVNRTAFDTSDVDFTIHGDQIKLSRIELIGDAISLIGNGYLEWARYADINFYSVVGRNRFHIPILSDLYKASSQRIMWINVGGPIDNLQTTRKVLPGLNDSIKALFQSSRTADAGPIQTNPFIRRR